MLSKRLKEETKTAHQSLEKQMVGHLKSITTTDEYAALLKTFYGYYKPIEVHLDRYFNDENFPFYSDRRKVAVILEDLAALEADTTMLPLAFHTPIIDSEAKALGSFYVLEGSTRGGEVIADMLIKQAGMTTANTRFFNVYAENKEMMWQTFKEKLNNWSADPAFQDEVIAAADNTFILFGEWMRERGI